MEHARRKFLSLSAQTHTLPRQSKYQFCDARGICLNGAFPDAHDEPALSLQSPVVQAISLSIGGDLRKPVGAIATARQFRFPGAPIVPMPKVAIAEQRDPRTGQHNVRTARQSPDIYAVS